MAVVDCDTHCMLPDAFEHMQAHLAARAPRLRFREADGSYDVVDFPGRWPHVPGATPKARTDNKLRGAAFVEDRVADLARLGVDKQLLMSNFTGWWSYLIDPRLGAGMAHSHNQSLLNILRRYPEQFAGIALVALQDVAASIAEIEWAREAGFSAAVVDHAYPVREHPYGTSLGEHLELWPFFARAEALEMPLFIHNVLHGHTVQNFPRLQALSLDDLSVSDAQVNLVSLIFSGLLDEFPGLQFIVAEQGTAWIEPLAERLDRRFARAPRNYADDENMSRAALARKAHLPPELRAKRNRMPPSDYFRKNFYWTIETEEPELVDAVRYVGAERFLFATDYPHDDPGGLMKWRDVEMLTLNKELTEREKRQIFSENAARLFRL